MSILRIFLFFILTVLLAALGIVVGINIHPIAGIVLFAILHQKLCASRE